MKIAAIALTSLMSFAAYAAEPPRVPDPPIVTSPTESKPVPRGHVCFNAGETREKIAQNRLSDPLRALRAGRLQGEALRAKLCRFKQDDYVYEVFVLRRDGRIVRLYMNAQTGQAIAAPSDTDRN